MNSPQRREPDFPTGLARRLDAACSLFEAQCQAGRLPRIEDFLEQVEPADRPALSAELLQIELHYRRPQGDLPASPPGQAALVGSVTVPDQLATSASAEAQPCATASVTPASPPGFELIEEIGHGGMGVVYRARDTALDRDVAVKVLSDHYAADSPAAQRFLGEARITGQLQHPGIPAVHHVGALADGRPFLAMRLIKGSTLAAILKEGRGTRGEGRGGSDAASAAADSRLAPDPSPFERGQLLAIFEAVCQAVGYAHAHRVIHRDLKPHNIMVGAFGEVQVMDWGLAKILGEQRPACTEALPEQPTQAWTQVTPTPDAGSYTQAGTLVGTPAFIAPEQALGEIEKVNERSDVFGLGALLAVILTGKPPYVGDTSESVRVQAVRGKLEDCFARLDASGAEPELVALCKHCLAFEPLDRPADAGAVAQAVAGLRAAADERARRAELERVHALGEQATAAARSAERRKRQRLALAAAAVLALAVVGGFLIVLDVQRRANAELAERNAALADEQAKVQARFELAQKAIALFHTGVSEDALLKNPQLKELRKRLLQEAVVFYADLEKMLAGQTDAQSRQALAAAYFQLGELTHSIGEKAEALAIHRKALALRRELAAAEGADAQTRLNVARSLRAEGIILIEMRDSAGALRAFAQQGQIAAALEADAATDAAATDAVRVILAQSHNATGVALTDTGHPTEALEAHQKALALRQKLADANRNVAEYQSDLALSHFNIGKVLKDTGIADNRAFTRKALAEFREALVIWQKLARAYPAVTLYRQDLSYTHGFIGMLLARTGQPEEALLAVQEAVAIQKKLVDAKPALIQIQADLAWSHIQLGWLLIRQKRFAEASTAVDTGLGRLQKISEADPNNADYMKGLGHSHAYRGWLLVRSEQRSQAAADLRRALELFARSKASSLDDRFERSRSLALLAGLGEVANSGVTTAEAAMFADHAVASLRDAFGAGWGQADELNEPDFNPLRSRADFQKLVAEVQTRYQPKLAK
jgi:serine/threonine protein kinase/tetratricopeptide (TPR) repeat protein